MYKQGYECDSCGKESDSAEIPLNWWRVAKRVEDINHCGVWDTKDFCCLGCADAWTAKECLELARSGAECRGNPGLIVGDGKG